MMNKGHLKRVIRLLFDKIRTNRNQSNSEKLLSVVNLSKHERKLYKSPEEKTFTL
jgi:hypothetical protein